MESPHELTELNFSDPERSIPAWLLELHPDGLLSQNGEQLITFTDQAIQLIDTVSSAVVWEYPRSDDELIANVRFSPDETLLFVFGRIEGADTYIRFIDIETQTIIHEISEPSTITRYALDDAWQMLSYSDEQGKISVLDLQFPDEPQRRTVIEGQWDVPLEILDFTDDGTWLYFIQRNPEQDIQTRLMAWNTLTSEMHPLAYPLNSIPADQGSEFFLTLSPLDPDTSQQTASIWDIENSANIIYEWSDYSATGTLLGSVNRESNLFTLDTGIAIDIYDDSGELLNSLQENACSGEFSPNGQYIVTLCFAEDASLSLYIWGID